MIKSVENYLASDTLGGQIDYWEPGVVSSQAAAQEEHRGCAHHHQLSWQSLGSKHKYCQAQVQIPITLSKQTWDLNMTSIITWTNGPPLSVKRCGVFPSPKSYNYPFGTMGNYYLLSLYVRA